MNNQSKQTLRIFISHSSEDNDFGIPLAHDLCCALGNDDIVWYDSAGGLFGGDIWWDKIVRELTASTTFILVLSPNAMNSEWVRREFFLAFSQKKRIIPVLHRQCKIWLDVKIHQVISFLPPRTYEEAFNDLLVAIRQVEGPFQGDFGTPSSTTVGPTKQPKSVSRRGLDNAECLRLKRRYALLSQRFIHISEKLEYLYKVLASRAPSAHAYEVQKDVEETEAECNAVEQQLEELERRIAAICE